MELLYFGHKFTFSYVFSSSGLFFSTICYVMKQGYFHHMLEIKLRTKQLHMYLFE